MDHDKKKSARAREASKKGPSLGWVIALSAAGGVVIGSTGTYILTQPQAGTEQPALSITGAPTPTQPIIPSAPGSQYTPAPQPPGEAPPGKVWSVEHGHWHDAPVTQPTTLPIVPPIPAPAVPEAPAK